MDLVIANSDTITSDFINYLVYIIQQLILNTKIDFHQLNQYFSAHFNGLDAGSIITLGAENILVLSYKTYIILSINPNVFIKGTLQNLKNMCQIINYGNLYVNGTHIFSDAFEYVSSNFNNIYYSYFLEG